MSDLKVVIIGGGSVLWMPHLAEDLFATAELRGSRLVLVDIDPAAATLMQRYCQMLADRQGTGWAVLVDDLDAALDGAAVVGVAISTGGLQAMHHDVSIPERFGVFHSVGDTVGPGGISRTLRNVPVFVDIARRMERHCPDAWMVHVTNPLAQITRCVNKATGIRCVGLCHNYLGTRAFLAAFLKCKREEVGATSVGVNHFTWLKDLTCRGRDVHEQMTLANYEAYEAAKPKQQQGSTEDAQPAQWHEMRYYLNFELYERFGYFPVGAASHVAENFPHYLNSLDAARRHRIHRKAVFPQRRAAHEEARAQIVQRVEGRQPLPPPIEESIEQLAPVVAALTVGKTTHTVVNVPNIGQIGNLPRGVVVETWATIAHNRIEPTFAGDVPSPVAGLVQLIVQEEELAVAGALSGNRDQVVQAMAVSPLLADKDRAAELTDALLAANAAWLPQFFAGRQSQHITNVLEPARS